MLKIYGSKISFPCNKVLFVANYLNLDYEFVELNVMAGEHKKPDYLKIHPFGKIPAIDDNGFTLFESNSIIRYFAEKNNSELYPKDLEEKTKVDQWLDFTGQHTNQAMLKVAFNRLFAKNLPMFEYSEDSVQEGLKYLADFLPVIEETIKKNGNLAGTKISVADFSLFATLEPCEAVEIDLSPYPSLAKWRNALKNQDWYTKVFPSFESFVKESFAALA